jgi:hypothetical protein
MLAEEKETEKLPKTKNITKDVTRKGFAPIK